MWDVDAVLAACRLDDGAASLGVVRRTLCGMFSIASVASLNIHDSASIFMNVPSPCTSLLRAPHPLPVCDIFNIVVEWLPRDYVAVRNEATQR